MSATTYKCPACGAPLAFDGESGMLNCASCGSAYELDQLDAMSGASEQKVEFDMQGEAFGAGEVQTYSCESCGAELLTEETTTATECPYCGSPIILNAQIDSGVRPEKVIPFTVTKEEAVQKFEEYFKGKKLMPNIFLNTRNRIAEMRKLYVPYWLFDCEAWGNMVFDCEKTSTTREGDYQVRRTEHFVVHRSGGMGFENIPVDGSVKMDNKITESLEPYDLSAAVDFQPAVLAGALADHADVNAEECEKRAAERVARSMEDKLRSTVHGYSRVSVRYKNIHSENGKARPVLMPVWLITTEKQEGGEKKTYTFAINGQTGKLTCDVKPAKGKSAAWFLGVFAGVCVLGYLLLAVLNMAGVFA